MHKLTREVRFSVNPFLPAEQTGYNSYTSQPPGEGLSLFFELAVQLQGTVDPDSGFVVNVLDIDRQVRRLVVPMLARRLREHYRHRQHIDLKRLGRILTAAGGQLRGQFGGARLDRLVLKLNPFRTVAVECEEADMICFSEKFEFAATHKLWNERFSAQRNFELFGKCAHPSGHGHNYVVEVTVRLGGREEEFGIGQFEKIVDTELIEIVDHKNLNVDIDEFGRRNPTVENIAAFAWDRLAGKLAPAKLHCVTVWETDKISCSYYGS